MAVEKDDPTERQKICEEISDVCITTTKKRTITEKVDFDFPRRLEKRAEATIGNDDTPKPPSWEGHEEYSLVRNMFYDVVQAYAKEKYGVKPDGSSITIERIGPLEDESVTTWSAFFMIPEQNKEYPIDDDSITM